MLVAYLAARTRDVAGAEDALADAFAAAIADWPLSGIPDSPEAWLLSVARRKTIDAVRRRRTGEAAADQVRLMVACAHPAIEAAIRAPLILQTILGFDAAAIASAFLVAPATMGQRLTRAKAKIKQAGIPFDVPERAELGERLDAVLAPSHTTFAEGSSHPPGTESRRRNLAGEALWLG